MGTPLASNEPANLCTTCWGPGKPFGEGPSPKVVEVRLTSLLPGEFHTTELEQLILTTHWLEQVINPCIYHINAGGLTWSLGWFSPFTTLSVIESATAHPVFDNQFAPLCSVDFGSTLFHALGTIMFGGFANITWSLDGTSP